MLAALATILTLSLVSADKGQLAVANMRPTYGYLGAVRPRTEGRLPGDVMHFSFDILNMKLDAGGRASYSVLVEVLDGKGQLWHRQGPLNATAQNYLGGNALPCSATMELPLDATPGTYTGRVTIHDRAANKSITFEGPGKVLAADFGLVRVGTFADREGKVPMAPLGVPGGSLYIDFATVGFGRDKGTRQPNLSVALRVLDEQGKPTFAEPLKGEANTDIAEDLKILPMQFGLTLNRVGRFTVELSATDRTSGKTSRVSFPIRVVPME